MNLETNDKSLELLREKLFQKSLDCEQMYIKCEKMQSECTSLRNLNSELRDQSSRQQNIIKQLHDQISCLSGELEQFKCTSTYKRPPALQEPPPAETISVSALQEPPPEETISVSTFNRCDCLEKSNMEENMVSPPYQSQCEISNLHTQSSHSPLTHSAQNESDDSIKPTNALIIIDSHGNGVDAKKMYKNNRVNLVVLPNGKKNISGANEYISNHENEIQPDTEIVIAVGSNDL